MPRRNRVLSDKSYTKLKDRIGETIEGQLRWLTREERRKYVEQVVTNYQKNYEPFHKVWESVQKVLLQLGVPRGMWGLYRSFAYHYTRAKMRGASQAQLDAIADYHIATSGLDASVVERIREVLGGAAQQ